MTFTFKSLQKVSFRYNNFHEFCFYIPRTFILIVVLVSKQHHEKFVFVGDIKTKFMKLLYLKSKLFVQNLNIKVMKIQDFNTNFTSNKIR